MIKCPCNGAIVFTITTTMCNECKVVHEHKCEQCNMAYCAHCIINTRLMQKGIKTPSNSHTRHILLTCNTA